MYAHTYIRSYLKSMANPVRYVATCTIYVYLIMDFNDVHNMHVQSLQINSQKQVDSSAPLLFKHLILRL